MVCVCVFFVLEVFELFGDFKSFIECCIVFFWFVIEFKNINEMKNCYG